VVPAPASVTAVVVALVLALAHHPRHSQSPAQQQRNSWHSLGRQRLVQNISGTCPGWPHSPS